MTSPLETINWLAAQFRDRANDDPDVHTTADATEVQSLFECFHDMVAALRADLAMVTDLKSALAMVERADNPVMLRARRRETDLLALIERIGTLGGPSDNDDDHPDPRIELMARALERARHPEWTDDEFETWWDRDPEFTVHVTRWFHFGPGTRKEHVLWEAEQCLKAMPGYADLAKPIKRGRT